MIQNKPYTADLIRNSLHLACNRGMVPVGTQPLPQDDVSSGQALPTGLLVMNADDWGRDKENTNRIFDCVVRGTVSTASAMVFMEDSARAASIAQESGVDTGLHLNLTTPFSGLCPAEVWARQQQISTYLRRFRFSSAVFHPGLSNAFEYVVNAQLDEYRRLYNADPQRIDGHHHMHLCRNVLLGKLLPAGTYARRNFSFSAGEKSYLNRFYRRTIDRGLARRHRLAEYFFALIPLDVLGRLERIFSLAKTHTVEVETHPVLPAEYDFLRGEEILRLMAGLSVAISPAATSASQRIHSQAL